MGSRREFLEISPRNYNFLDVVHILCNFCQDRPVYFDGKPLHNCVLKENFMRALGLQQRHKTSDIRSMAEFLVNNIVATGVESNCFNSVTGEDPCFQTRAVGRFICDVGSEKSYQSLSEETSDSSEKKTNPDSLTRKKRRSSLPKEDLERLREKERLAKRRQRAKNKKVKICCHIFQFLFLKMIPLMFLSVKLIVKCNANIYC